MIRIVRRKEGIGAGENAVEFNVYRCLTDGATVFGYMRHAPASPGSGALFEGSSYGVPAAAAFREACRYAQEHHIPTVVVVDPHDLFTD